MVHMPYEYLDHQADLGIRGIGHTLHEALSEGAQAMLAAMANLDTVQQTQQFVQRCTAPDIPSLFVEWLNELLYQREVNDVLFASARVVHLEQHPSGWTLEAIACGETLDPDRHEIHIEVKAATYFGLAYEIQGDRHVVQCVVDV
jgi:SHS2 domain-containing protein